MRVKNIGWPNQGQIVFDWHWLVWTNE